MKLVLGTFDYPPHPYHYKYIDDTWVFSDIAPRNPKIKKIDATNIPYKELEAIYASHLLEHLKDPLKALRHWHDCLMEGGYVQLNVPDMEWALDNLMAINAGDEPLSNFYRTFEKCKDILVGACSADHDRHLSWFNKTKLNKYLKKAGFKDIKITKEYEAHDMGCLIAYAKK
jgi:predicted SAM-dependent methyltransferase